MLSFLTIERYINFCNDLIFHSEKNEVRYEAAKNVAILVFNAQFFEFLNVSIEQLKKYVSFCDSNILPEHHYRLICGNLIFISEITKLYKRCEEKSLLSDTIEKIWLQQDSHLWFCLGFLLKNVNIDTSHKSSIVNLQETIFYAIWSFLDSFCNFRDQSVCFPYDIFLYLIVYSCLDCDILLKQAMSSILELLIGSNVFITHVSVCDKVFTFRFQLLSNWFDYFFHKNKENKIWPLKSFLDTEFYAEDLEKLPFSLIGKSILWDFYDSDKKQNLEPFLIFGPLRSSIKIVATSVITKLSEYIMDNRQRPHEKSIFRLINNLKSTLKDLADLNITIERNTQKSVLGLLTFFKKISVQVDDLLVIDNLSIKFSDNQLILSALFDVCKSVKAEKLLDILFNIEKRVSKSLDQDLIRKNIKDIILCSHKNNEFHIENIRLIWDLCMVHIKRRMGRPYVNTNKFPMTISEKTSLTLLSFISIVPDLFSENEWTMLLRKILEHQNQTFNSEEKHAVIIAIKENIFYKKQESCYIFPTTPTLINYCKLFCSLLRHDYTVSEKGDVGSHVRIACMEALTSLTSTLLIKEKSGLVTDLIEKISSLLHEQYIGARIDRLKNLAFSCIKSCGVWNGPCDSLLVSEGCLRGTFYKLGSLYYNDIIDLIVDKNHYQSIEGARKYDEIFELIITYKENFTIKNLCKWCDEKHLRKGVLRGIFLSYQKGLIDVFFVEKIGLNPIHYHNCSSDEKILKHLTGQTFKINAVNS